VSLAQASHGDQRPSRIVVEHLVEQMVELPPDRHGLILHEGCRTDADCAPLPRTTRQAGVSR
jgi:hypothetical protein